MTRSVVEFLDDKPSDALTWFLDQFVGDARDQYRDSCRANIENPARERAVQVRERGLDILVDKVCRPEMKKVNAKADLADVTG
ncbi:MAG: hypothetical protein NTZ72_13815 [Afipia sp.]|nr:hypothetical protein [Afipia sp.]